MSETADRYARVAADFTERVTAVPPAAWDNPAPCEKWVARDVVQHVVEVAGQFLGDSGADLPAPPSVQDDPLGAWTTARDAIEAGLRDPDVAGAIKESPMGAMTFEQMVGFFGIADLLIHTWDLARATGLDETLNPAEVHRLFEAMQPMDEMMRKGDAFGPKVEVAADADEQTRLIAFTGRTP
ncbi:MAG TPA: TIGR03086 family metal-binding protein [Sporichthya sp.]|nr:TIGR03086 family metal-binding protein [Sporichthya sp.]